MKAGLVHHRLELNLGQPVAFGGAQWIEAGSAHSNLDPGNTVFELPADLGTSLVGADDLHTESIRVRPTLKDVRGLEVGKPAGG